MLYLHKAFSFSLEFNFDIPSQLCATKENPDSCKYTKLSESYVILFKLMEMSYFLHITAGNLFSRSLLPFKSLIMTNSGMKSFLTFSFLFSPGKMHHYFCCYSWFLDKNPYREAKPPLPTLGLQLKLKKTDYQQKNTIITDVVHITWKNAKPKVGNSKRWFKFPPYLESSTKDNNLIEK